MSADPEAFKREAARKQTQYERLRKAASDKVLAFYREKFGTVK